MKDRLALCLYTSSLLCIESAPKPGISKKGEDPSFHNDPQKKMKSFEKFIHFFLVTLNLKCTVFCLKMAKEILLMKKE
jgi:hypothetical protein